jgi:hypothetical protein
MRGTVPVSAAGATLVASAPASATIYERFEYDGTFEGHLELCGLDVHWEGHFTGGGRIREGKNSDARLPHRLRAIRSTRPRRLAVGATFPDS